MCLFDDVKCIGINDASVNLFEGQYRVNGMAYNSYLIKDEKTAVLDTVDLRYGETWINNIRSHILAPDYLIITHLEPDHSSNIALFVKEFPNAKIVANAKAFSMIKNFYGLELSDKKIEVKDGETFSLGKHELLFIAAPMVHWPEVQMIFDKTNGVLFSADAFGRFGAPSAKDDWTEQARRYYIGIVGKYGAQVQNVLKKVANMPVKAIYPLHGEQLTENLGYYLNLYNLWSSYSPEKTGTVIIYTSVYGNTEKAVECLADEIKALTGIRPPVYNLSTCDITEALSKAFEYSSVVLATTTYNAEIFPLMNDFIARLTERNFSNRKIGLIENGSWAPMAVKVMCSLLEKCKNLTYCNEKVKILSALTEENKKSIKLLAKELSE